VGKYSIILLFLAFFISCEAPTDLNRTGDKLCGYITHVDTNLILGGGYYSVSVFSADSADPFRKIPIRCDSLRLTKRNNLYESTYDMNGIPQGRFHVAATWSHYPRIPNEVPIVLGTLGCDTSRSCIDHIILLYPNYHGNFQNFVSWTDTTKRLN
jgi:hypothetical protein